MPRITSRQIKEFRTDAFGRQLGLCCYCDDPMWETDPISFGAEHAIPAGSLWSFQCTTEHLVARADGGGHERDNIAAACRGCNQLRHETRPALSHIDFRILVQAKIQDGTWKRPDDVRIGRSRILVKGGAKLSRLMAQPNNQDSSETAPAAIASTDFKA